MIAPLTPAFAEEAWLLLHPNQSETPSIFEDSWPSFDTLAEDEASMPTTQTCVLTVNGKRKFTAEITVPSQGISEHWLKTEMLENTEEGKAWSSKPQNAETLSRVERIVAGKGGRFVNLVLKKE